MKNLKEQINKDFMTAFKRGESGRVEKNFLGVIKGEIQNSEGRKNWEATDENVLKILKKSEKSLKENIDKGVDGAEAELKMLSPYLPDMMSEEKIKEIVAELVKGGSDNIGLIMKEFNMNYRGKADNKLVKDVAVEILN